MHQLKKINAAAFCANTIESFIERRYERCGRERVGNNEIITSARPEAGADRTEGSQTQGHNESGVHLKGSVCMSRPDLTMCSSCI